MKNCADLQVTVTDRSLRVSSGAGSLCVHQVFKSTRKRLSRSRGQAIRTFTVEVNSRRLLQSSRHSIFELLSPLTGITLNFLFTCHLRQLDLDLLYRCLSVPTITRRRRIDTYKSKTESKLRCSSDPADL